jgi:hypothetical protein
MNRTVSVANEPSRSRVASGKCKEYVVASGRSSICWNILSMGLISFFPVPKNVKGVDTWSKAVHNLIQFLVLAGCYFRFTHSGMSCQISKKFFASSSHSRNCTVDEGGILLKVVKRKPLPPHPSPLFYEQLLGIAADKTAGDDCLR